MTKEECVALLYRYAEYDGMGIPNLARCREAMKMAADMLSQPFLPSNLDGAAEEFCDKVFNEGCCTCLGMSKAFKAGAEWMVNQGVSTVAISNIEDGITEEGMKSIADYLESLPDKTEVVLQIRKKQ